MAAMEDNLQDKTGGQICNRVTKKMVSDLHHKCMVRTAPEEFNLAVNMDEQDMLAAEFIRTWANVTFPGGKLVQLYDSCVASSP